MALLEPVPQPAGRQRRGIRPRDPNDIEAERRRAPDKGILKSGSVEIVPAIRSPGRRITV
jgi:hypothetical protein